MESCAPVETVAALPETLRGRMRLVHYPDAFDPASSAIAVLHEGDVLHPRLKFHPRKDKKRSQNQGLPNMTAPEF